MNLSLKATRYVIDALEHYQKYHDAQIKQEGLSEDEISDFVNDRQYLDAIKQDFKRYRNELMHQRETEKQVG